MNTKQTNGKCTPVNYELLYSLAEGSGFNLISSKEDHYTREVMGNEIVEHARDFMEYHFGVISSGDKGMTIKFQYSNRRHESLDSDSQTDIDFSHLIGDKAGFVISQTGKLSDFRGFGKLPKIEILDQQVSIGKHQYINEIKELFPKLPDRPIPIGGTWTNKQIIKEPVIDGVMIFSREFVYTLLEGTKKDEIDCLKIECQFTSDVEGKIASDGIEFTLNLTGKGSETLFFAHKAGMFLSREGQSILEGSAETPADYEFGIGCL